MNILYSFSRLFSKRGSYVDEDWDNCFTILSDTLLRHKSQEVRFLNIHNDLKRWRKLPITSKEEEFPKLFLNLKTFVTRFSKLPDLFEESFNERIKFSLGKHLEKENIRLLFDDKESQQILLSKYFIIKILNDSKKILGSANNNMLSRGIEFCEAIPEIKLELIEGSGLVTIDSNRPLTVLKDLSHQLAKKLSYSFGDARISGLFKNSHANIRNQYGLLEVFPFLLDLIPEKYLRFEDINTLDNAYLRDALKNTVKQLTSKNAEIEKKNLDLERTKLELKKLTNKLQVINDIDRTILKSDSLDQFIYGTLDVLQSKMNLKKTSLVFFDFDKQIYSEHQLRKGIPIVNRRMIQAFDGDITKLKNAEYDLTQLSFKENPNNQKLFYPIVEQGQLIASISFEGEEQLAFNKEFIETVKELSGGMAISIVNKKLQEELRKRNKDMTDSLYYAQRIQNALIPSFENFNKLFNDSFVMFRPKDVVSGDFYWAHETFDNRKIWVTADCTGHGVPGAIMSVIGFNILNKVVVEKGIWEPDKILDELKANIIETLSQKGDKLQAKDGMDVSICVFNPNRGTLQYSGALNSVFVVKAETDNLKLPNTLNIKEHSDNMIELLPDKMPAAYFEGNNVPFSKTTILVEKGDSIYSFSDGYADQFGGERDKKFMVKNFRKLISSVSHLPMIEQKTLIEEAFIQWKGDRDQIDDVCVIGVKIEDETIL